MGQALHVDAHREQEEEDTEPEEYRGEQTDEQLLEDHTLLGRLLAGTGSVLVRSADLEDEEPGREEGSQADQNCGQHRKRRRRNRGDVPHHGVHCVYLRREGVLEDALTVMNPRNTCLNPGKRRLKFFRKTDVSKQINPVDVARVCFGLGNRDAEYVQKSTFTEYSASLSTKRKTNIRNLLPISLVTTLLSLPAPER